MTIKKQATEIDYDYQLQDIVNDKPLIYPVMSDDMKSVEKTDPFTVQRGLILALNHRTGELSLEQQYTRFGLMKKVKQKTQLDDSEVAVIKDLVAKAHTVLVAGQLLEILGGKK